MAQRREKQANRPVAVRVKQTVSSWASSRGAIRFATRCNSSVLTSSRDKRTPGRSSQSMAKPLDAIGTEKRKSWRKSFRRVSLYLSTRSNFHAINNSAGAEQCENSATITLTHFHRRRNNDRAINVADVRAIDESIARNAFLSISVSLSVHICKEDVQQTLKSEKSENAGKMYF